ncbi:MAG TPA: nuclease-related domain-containing protein [Anaerolineales bacterium]|nr:nuclease-related domain-containing protein [Anaerolineales bacterium]
MRKIDSVWSGLYEGYLNVRKAQRKLELQWARAIRVAEKRKHHYQHRDWMARISAQRNRYLLMKIVFPIGFIALFTCALFSSILPFVIISWGAAFFFSLVLVGIFIAQKVTIHNLEKSPPRKPVDGQILINITDRWWHALKPPPIVIRRDGDEGEKALLKALESRLTDRYIALHQYLVRRNLDADVLLLGPSGIWLLESKFNSGKIICQDGEWTQEKYYFETGGKQAFKSVPKKPYDKQWLAEKNSITQTILRRLPKDRHWVIGEIRGGIVFTHNEVTLEIDRSCQVEYGLISDWVKKISASPAVPNLTTEVLLCIVDAVLEYAHEISEGNGRQSAKQLAIQVYNIAEANIPVFVKNNL